MKMIVLSLIILSESGFPGFKDLQDEDDCFIANYQYLVIGIQFLLIKFSITYLKLVVNT